MAEKDSLESYEYAVKAINDDGIYSVLEESQTYRIRKLVQRAYLDGLEKRGKLDKKIGYLLKMLHNHDNQGAYLFQITDKQKLEMFAKLAEEILEPLHNSGEEVE